MIANSVGCIDGWRDLIEVDWTVLAIGCKAKPVPEAALADLRKEEFTDRQLSFWLCIDRLEQDWSMRHGISALPVFFDFLISRYPVERVGEGGQCHEKCECEGSAKDRRPVHCGTLSHR